jgi:hypothetical protein
MDWKFMQFAQKTRSGVCKWHDVGFERTQQLRIGVIFGLLGFDA